MPRRDLVIAPVCEAALLTVAGLAAWFSHQPLIFTSLGPTAYELIETPERRTATPYCVLVGHLVGVGAGFAALAVTHAWSAPAATSGHVVLLRVWAAALSAFLTVLGTLLLRAAQPAALSTTLLISLGTMQQWRDGPLILGAVLLMLLLGEPLRRWRLTRTPDDGEMNPAA